MPWGLWITIDLSSIAVSAGAFSLCASVYLFGLKRYEPIARTATFVGLIGYTMAMLALILDIGRPTVLEVIGILEYTLPALGSDDVCDALHDRASF